MTVPLKIIHKFKNNNRRIQYIQYIYIGQNVDDEIMTILESIKNKTFYETFEFLSKPKIDKLINYYGEKWYIYFFNKYHLNDQINSIIKNINKKKIIEAKMGKEWMAFNIITPSVRKLTYSFASNYYDYLISKNKIKSVVRKTDMDFRTYKNEQIGGNDNMYELDGETDDNGYLDNDECSREEEDENEDEENPDQIEEDINNEFNLEELTNLYSKEIDYDVKNIKDTAKLISEATNNKSLVKQINNIELEFNDKYDDINYDTKLEDIYQKVYIKDEFIYMDDTIKTIKQKITVSIPLSNKFSSNDYNIKLLPEYIYLWSEYNLNNEIDRIMLGQKWIRRNEMVMIDIKPNDNLAVYENLRNNLSYLKDSFGVKIKREDDEYNILRDYEEYMNNYEIYMIDIINELGLNYNVESTKKSNIYEVYVNIYYPLISFDRFESILDLLNNNNEKEIEKNMNNFEVIKMDMLMEREISNVVDNNLNPKFSSNFEENHIIQSIIHINLNNPKNLTGTVSTSKYNLYKIFDNFIVSEEYPFIQFQTPDAQLTYKFYTKTKKIDDTEILAKWFENAPYGISFKIKMQEIENKYISINLNETGRLEYKITWKEEDNATMESIKESFKYVNNLLLKINNENKKVKIILPEEDSYKYAFINTIQKFTLTSLDKSVSKKSKALINHNELSDFSRFFYTYVALVIEPRKRVSKSTDANTFSKFGTYLRYKRISNYENKTKMHLRMLYFLRNFEISDKELIDEIAKQFNITQESAAEELDLVKKKYGKILGKVKKTLTKLKSLPKAKPPGIGIDIQGRTPDNYKIRITGARSKEQLNEIINFIQVLLYLYVEIYINKNSKFLKIKDTLNKLNKIAKRRNKVNDMVDYESEQSIVKQVTSLDKKRLGFKPEEGQNQWTRSCQNSGDDKKRRPLIVNDIKDLIKKGFKLNTKTDTYEKTSIITEKGKKKTVTVKAIKLPGDNGTFNYYTCDPDENNEHCYIGFLSKSNNPNELCMPCCFKKDQSDTNNLKKKNYYLECLGQKAKDTQVKNMDDLGDKVYILQDTNKIQDGRFIFLPNYMNQLFNIIWKNSYIIKNHYLIESSTGYYFKYTVKDNQYHFLTAMSNIFNLSIDEIKEKIINVLKNDDDTIFTYLNNGDIKSMFKERDNFINYINNSNYLEYEILGELLALPNVLTSNGLFYFVFNKKTKIIKKALEKDIEIENYYLQCLNYENQYQINENRDFIILIREGKYYFPIYNVKKGTKDKKIILTKTFTDNDLITELKQYYNMSCIESFIFKVNKAYNITAKNIYNSNVGIIKKQIIDMRNKVKYVKLDTGLILPVRPSGTNLNIKISNIDELKNSELLDIHDTIKLLNKFNAKYSSYKYIPKIVNYNNIKDGKYNIISILLMNNLIIPIKNEYVNASIFKKYGVGYEFQSMEEVIDNVIIENDIPMDERNINVKNRIYRNEAFNLFRLELSLYLSDNNSIRNNIINLVRDEKLSKKTKRKELFQILMNIIEGKVKNTKFIEIIKELPNFSKNDYAVSNVRDYCSTHKTKDKCSANLHCTYINNTCKFVMYKTDLIHNIYKVVEEMVNDSIKFKEIIQEDEYYVSDIVDYTQFSYRQNQKIIKTTNFNIKKIMEELFGQESVPQIGRRRIGKQDVIVVKDVPDMIELGKEIIQEIISNKNSIIRSYVNSYYWLLNPLYDKESRNLGYESELQDRLTNLFKANMIDFLLNNTENDQFKKDISKYIDINNSLILSKNIFNSILNKFRKNNYNTDGIFELIILSYMFPFPIVVYNNYNIVKYIFSSGPVNVNDKTISKYTNEIQQHKTIFIKLDYEGSSSIPNKIYSIYYK